MPTSDGEECDPRRIDVGEERNSTGGETLQQPRNTEAIGWGGYTAPVVRGDRREGSRILYTARSVRREDQKRGGGSHWREGARRKSLGYGGGGERSKKDKAPASGDEAARDLTKTHETS